MVTLGVKALMNLLGGAQYNPQHTHSHSDQFK